MHLLTTTLYEVLHISLQLVDVYVKRKFRLPSMNCDQRVYNIVSKCWDLDPHTRPSFDMLAKEMGDLYNMVVSANPTSPPSNTASANATTASSPSSSSSSGSSSSASASRSQPVALTTSTPHSSSNSTSLSTGSTQISASSTSAQSSSHSNSSASSNSAPSIHHPTTTTVSVPTLLSHLNSAPPPGLHGHAPSHMLSHHNSVAPPSIMT